MSAADPTRLASRLLIFLLSFVGLATAALAGASLAPRSAVDPTATRALAAGEEGTDPFTDDLRLIEEIPRAGRTSDSSSDSSSDAGGLSEPAEQACDKPALVASLRADPAKRSVWLTVLGVSDADSSSYIDALRPVTLNNDSVVLNHGFADGQAQPSPTVLQAGTIVLVDRDGVPRVLCKCGNPLLTAPQTALEQPIRDTWDGFDPEAVVSVTPNPTSPPAPTPPPIPDSPTEPAAPPTATPVSDVSTPTPAQEPPVTATALPTAATALPTVAPTSVATLVPEPTITPSPPPSPSATPAPTTSPTATPVELPEVVLGCRAEPLQVSRATSFQIVVSWTPPDTLVNTVIELGTIRDEPGGATSPVTSGPHQIGDSGPFGLPILVTATVFAPDGTAVSTSTEVCDVEWIDDLPAPPTPVECDPDLVDACCPDGSTPVGTDGNGEPICPDP